MLLVLVVDVPVHFSNKFQQSKVYVLAVHLFQFIDDLWTFLLCSKNRYIVSWYRKLWSSRSCSFKIIERPIRTVLNVQKTIKTPRLLLNTVIDVPIVKVVQVVDIPVVTQRLMSMVLLTMKIPQLLGKGGRCPRSCKFHRSSTFLLLRKGIHQVLLFHMMFDVLVVQVQQVSLVQAVKTADTTQLQLVVFLRGQSR